MKVFLFHNRARFPELCAPTLHSPLSQAHKAARSRSKFSALRAACALPLARSSSSTDVFNSKAKAKAPSQRVQCSMPRIAHKKETLLHVPRVNNVRVKNDSSSLDFFFRGCRAFLFSSLELERRACARFAAWIIWTRVTNIMMMMHAESRALCCP
jgi:hypothetical protein